MRSSKFLKCLPALLVLTLVNCGGGGGGGSGDDSADFYTNNSCSLLKLATSADINGITSVAIPKIINGESCSASGSPVVELLLANTSNEGFACSATMLTDRYALTAAHCFDGDVNRAGVRINGEVVGVEAVKVDPAAKNSDDRYVNDLAIIRLVKSVSNQTVPILVSRNVIPGDKLYIFGYGRSTPGTAEEGTDEQLRGGIMKVDSVDPLSIFAKYEGQGQNACFGDSGGPALIDVDGTLALAGVTSTGSNNTTCGEGVINLFTNIQGSAGLGFITTYVPNVQTR